MVPPVFRHNVVESEPEFVVFVIVAIEVQVPLGEDGCNAYEPIPVVTRLVNAFDMIAPFNWVSFWALIALVENIFIDYSNLMS